MEPMANGMGGRRCGWVERGWTFTKNKMTQIDTSRHSLEGQTLEAKTKKVKTVSRQGMAKANLFT